MLALRAFISLFGLIKVFIYPLDVYCKKLLCSELSVSRIHIVQLVYSSIIVVNQVSCTILYSNVSYLKRCYAQNDDDDVFCDGMQLDHRVCDDKAIVSCLGKSK